MTNLIQSKRTYSDKELELIKTQAERAIESYLQLFSQLVNIGTVLAIVDVTIIGFSITQKIVGILLFASFIPILLLVITLRIYKIMFPFIYAAISLEYKFGHEEIDWVGQTYLSIDLSPEHVNLLKDISNIENRTERMKKLKGMIPRITWRYVPVLLGIIVIGHIFASLILYYYFRWKLF
jgi:hypothetical protein